MIYLKLSILHYHTHPLRSDTYCFRPKLNGVSLWPRLPLSPNSILPILAGPKHKEKEFEVSPAFAKMLGTETFSIPSPNKPFGAAELKNAPLWSLPHLKNNISRYQ